MSTKPTYEALLARINALEAELETLRQSRTRWQHRESVQREVQKMALLGYWELDLASNTLYWSDEIYRIFELDPERFGATYEAFLAIVHPDDRAHVNSAYLASVSNRSGYDIVHRLLLREGELKYVHEKGVTQYRADGSPLRSLGTVQDVTRQYLETNTCCGLVGKHERMRDIYRTIDELTEVDVPVLIQGESGTGKELVANAIHRKSARSAKPFVPVNCGALPETLLESELFGHIRGAFTGAIRNKKGRFELADGGTLFLDEIADLSKPVQVKLLRVLQEGAFEPVGGEQTLSVNVRIISAANRDLKNEVEAGRLREDLYYRIKVVPIELPPLRERRSDIPQLLDHFVARAVREGYQFAGIEDEAMGRLVDYSWPGNVRELQSAVHYALIKARGTPVSARHLPVEILSQRPVEVSAQPETLMTQLSEFQEYRKNRASPYPRIPKLNAQRVRAALDESRGNKVKAAQLLGVGRATLYRFLKGRNL
jgi:sigma-54 dependent transcriptional regulator, acetoin dehydrogenase operon transcriptional activator AcoR